MVDPSTSFASSSQGLLGNGVYYNASLNKMLSLPFTVAVNKTVVKAAQCTDGGTCAMSYTSACGGYAAQGYSMLTVVSAVPNDGANGGNTFRPPYVAGTKPTHMLSGFDFTRLPKRTDITVTQTNLDTIAARWGKPYPDVFGTDRGRCFVPGYYPDDYAAGIGQAVLQDILLLVGNTGALNATAAERAVVQRGLDIYYSWQAGNNWDCGAGQCLGRKPPMIYMAALSTNATIQSTVAASPSAGDFQEDTQIAVTPNSGGAPVWGADAYGSAWPALNARFHWSAVFASKCYDGANGGNPAASCKDADSKGAVGDPYGYIDGPSGLPSSQYGVCCSGGPIIGLAAAMQAWENFCEVGNDQETLAWADKMAYPSLTTAPGVTVSGDGCAPPDSRESSSCDGYNGNNCLYFGGRTGATDANSTWGPLPSNPAQCIPNNSNGNTGQTGRFSWLNGQRFISFTTTAGSISYNKTPGYFPTIAKNQYATIRTATPHCANGTWTP